MSQKSKNNKAKSNTQGGQKKTKNPLREERLMAQTLGPKKVGRQKSVAAAYATGQIARPPVITMTQDTCRIVHRELISSVTGSVAFTVSNTFALNPGLPATFPWLSTMAASWQKYRFRKLRFCAFTRTGSNVPGSLMLCPDYNASEASPATEQVASSYQDTAEDAPWKDIICVLNPKSMAGPEHHFTRTGALAANLDVKTYDVGNLFVCTVDGTAVNWSKLWVEYDVDFYVPQLPPGGGIDPVGGFTTGATTQTAANPFGVAPVVDVESVGIAMNTASVLTIVSPGDYVLAVSYAGTVITAITALTLVGATSVGQSNVIDTATGLTAGGHYRIRVTATNATVAFALTATTVTSALLSVGRAPDNSLN